MKTVFLAAVNAKYIHSNLAVYSMKAYCREYEKYVEIGEYTINQQKDEILKSIYKKKPDILCFSCYIWNISFVEELICDLKKFCLKQLSGQEVLKFLMMQKILTKDA